MNIQIWRLLRATAVFTAMVLAGGAGLAAKPEGVGQGKDKDKDKPLKEKRVKEIQVGGYFGDQQRVVVTEYYGKRYVSGKCPPGLKKKNNGCLPPGQAKKWAKGEPLPRTVVYYPVPQEVVVRIGVPPPGYRYVRVANDLLLIAIGTSIVIDAIEDLIRQ